MKELPLNEMSINQLFVTGKHCVFEVPIYQRNYAWEWDEISALIQDVYDAMKKDSSKPYYIGTLVSFRKDDDVFEIIDGQQRLTTIRILMAVLNIGVNNPLKYRARKKSDKTIEHLKDFQHIEEKDNAIVNGYKFAESAYNGIVVSEGDKTNFVRYFLNEVKIIHYQVPRDIDLNHYFEVMNSRGEQLEKHEIVKANLMQKLTSNKERGDFNIIWEACAQMSVYVQQNISDVDIRNLSDFDSLTLKYEQGQGKISINKILEGNMFKPLTNGKVVKESFQPIIDFPNFLLIVLKITLMSDSGVVLDDKELLKEFRKVEFDTDRVKKFAINLLKARYFLDNFVVHHANEDDVYGSNPWQLQILLRQDSDKKEWVPKNLADNNKPLQDKLVHLLSMFEVSFTARQRKNYLFYLLLYLINNQADVQDYKNFVENLANGYIYKVYLDEENLNEVNTPNPNSFDNDILSGFFLDDNTLPQKTAKDFSEIYGDGTEKSAGVPLFVFNYLDYRIWELYSDTLRGEKSRKGSTERHNFFKRLGCSDFELDIFNNFYFSRTRRSLEHYFPQANIIKENAPNENQINCFGNYAMISASANSMGSNWDPQTKIDHYLKDTSGKINRIGVASLKFWIMMQICKDNNGDWNFETIKQHQKDMLDILLG